MGLNGAVDKLKERPKMLAVITAGHRKYCSPRHRIRPPSPFNCYSREVARSQLVQRKTRHSYHTLRLIGS